MSLCPYKNMFGQERTGIHAYRVFDIAIVDLGATVLVGLLLAYYFKWNYLLTLLVLFLIGVVAHRLFCVNTTLNMMIFGKV